MRASLLNSYAATGWTPILISNEVPYVRATIKGPLLVGACDTLKLDASLSVGAGIAPMDYKWKARARAATSPPASPASSRLPGTCLGCVCGVLEPGCQLPRDDKKKIAK